MRDCYRAYRLDGQPLAALGPPALEDIAAAGARHPLAETVLALGVPLLRLIGSLRHIFAIISNV